MHLARIKFAESSGRLFAGSGAVKASVTLLLALFCLSFLHSFANAETRTLRMYYTHSKESATITFKKNGRYIKSGLRKANRFLRDWRRKEPTRMDPALLDLVWEVYKASGSRSIIYVISGYRSPKTNRMLRRRGRKVARTSMHTRGKALDFFLKDVSVKKLRALGLKAHRGGVGYYSGSFVHLDTGRVRHWPRMSRRQLSRIFPRGKTIHVPSNGKPLRGYKTALLNLKKGRNADGSRRRTVVQKTLLARIFSGGGSNDDDGDGANAKVAALKTSTRKPKAKKAVAVAKAAPKPKPKKAKGPDPFSLESKAAADTAAKEKAKAAKKALEASKKLEAEKKLKEAEEAEAKAVELAKAEEAAKLAETARASLVPTRATVPQRRPQPATQVALASSPDTGVETKLAPIRATELALATPPAEQQIVRPVVEIPEASPSVKANSEQDITQLKQRIETALATPRQLSTAERATQIASNAQLVSALKSVPIPKSPLKRPEVQQPVELASVQPSKAIPLPAKLTAGSEPKEVSRATILASASALPDTVSRPAWRSKTVGAVRDNSAAAKSAEKAYEVPVPTAKPTQDLLTPAVAAVSTGSDEEDAKYLELGNLDGQSVKKWAVSQSTRVGPAAQLQAPVYKQGTTRAVPSSVYAVGFAFKSAPLRADRFSGRALTRVAFAHFGKRN